MNTIHKLATVIADPSKVNSNKNHYEFHKFYDIFYSWHKYEDWAGGWVLKEGERDRPLMEYFTILGLDNENN